MFDPRFAAWNTRWHDFLWFFLPHLKTNGRWVPKPWATWKGSKDLTYFSWDGVNLTPVFTVCETNLSIVSCQKKALATKSRLVGCISDLFYDTWSKKPVDTAVNWLFSMIRQLHLGSMEQKPGGTESAAGTSWLIAASAWRRGIFHGHGVFTWMEMDRPGKSNGWKKTCDFWENLCSAVMLHMLALECVDMDLWIIWIIWIMADADGGFFSMGRMKSSIWIPFKEYPNYATIYTKESIDRACYVSLFCWVGVSKYHLHMLEVVFFSDGHPSMFCDV